MEIKYLTALRDNPAHWPNATDGREGRIIPMSIIEIQELENLYNSGKSFPLALRELLFLAGKNCYILDYGSRGTIQSMQIDVRQLMQEENKTMSRPFLALDVYNYYDQFVFVFLDEGDDPAVYEGYYTPDSSNIDPEAGLVDPTKDWYRKIQPSLSIFINRVALRVRDGGSAF